MWIRRQLIPSFLLLLGLASQALATTPSQSLPEHWTAQEAVRFALAHSPDSAIGQQRLLAAQAAIDLERSAMAPQVNLTAQYSQTNAPMYSFGNILNQREFSPTINFNQPGRTDSLSSGLQLGYRLFNGGRDQAGVKAAEYGAEAARLELTATQARLAFEVVRAFYGIRQAWEMISISQDSAEAIAASLKTAQARQEEGVLLRDGVLDLEVQLAQAKEGIIGAEHALALAKKVFLTLLGTTGGEVEIAPSSSDPDQGEPSPPRMNTRPELKTLDAMINAAQARVSQARAGALPTVDGFAGVSREEGTITGGGGDSWQAGGKMLLPLADGGRTASEVARATASLAAMQGERQKLELAIGLEIEQARLALREADERLTVSEKTVAQARESAEINRARFAEGVVLSSDLLAVETRLTEVMTRRTVAKTARQIAIADLRRASGLPQFDDL